MSMQGLRYLKGEYMYDQHWKLTFLSRALLLHSGQLFSHALIFLHTKLTSHAYIIKA